MYRRLCFRPNPTYAADTLQENACTVECNQRKTNGTVRQTRELDEHDDGRISVGFGGKADTTVDEMCDASTEITAVAVTRQINVQYCISSLEYRAQDTDLCSPAAYSGDGIVRPQKGREQTCHAVTTFGKLQTLLTHCIAVHILQYLMKSIAANNDTLASGRFKSSPRAPLMYTSRASRAGSRIRRAHSCLMISATCTGGRSSLCGHGEYLCCVMGRWVLIK